MIGNLPPLTEVKGTGHFDVPEDRTAMSRGYYKVICRECGDVTREESHFTVDGEATLAQATVFRARHLARHLAALANEMQEAAR